MGPAALGTLRPQPPFLVFSPVLSGTRRVLVHVDDVVDRELTAHGILVYPARVGVSEHLGSGTYRTRTLLERVTEPLLIPCAGSDRDAVLALLDAPRAES